LKGDDPGMFDVLVRMIDTQGKEVLPAEFMASRRAQRSLEEHRSLGGRCFAVVRRATQAGMPLRTPVEGNGE